MFQHNQEKTIYRDQHTFSSD